MGLLKSRTDKAAAVAEEAQEAWDTGVLFYILEAGTSFKSAVKGVPDALEAVESVGWSLEHVSHVWSTDMSNHAIGYYLFRRGE